MEKSVAIERRRYQRHPFDRIASLRCNLREEDGYVSNISETGACVEGVSVDEGDVVAVQLARGSTVWRYCVAVWSKAGRAGLSFLGAPFDRKK